MDLSFRCGLPPLRNVIFSREAQANTEHFDSDDVSLGIEIQHDAGRYLARFRGGGAGRSEARGKRICLGVVAGLDHRRRAPLSKWAVTTRTSVPIGRFHH